VEIISIPSNKEDPLGNIRNTILEKPPSQLFKLNEIEFSLSVLMTRTSPPLLPILQKISLMFS